MLPVIQNPKFNTILPISKTPVQYRAFTVKEEKILLLAKEAKTATDMMTSMLQVVDNCTFGSLDLNKLNIVDLEHLFLQIRIKSVGEISELHYKCLNKLEDGKQCDGIIDIELDLQTIKPSEFDKASLRVKVTDTIGIQFRLPTIDDSLHMVQDLDQNKSEDGFLYRILDFVWDGDEITPANEVTEEEFLDFLESLGREGFNKVNTVVDSLPGLTITIPTKCPKCSKESSVILEGIDDFF